MITIFYRMYQHAPRKYKELSITEFFLLDNYFREKDEFS